MKVAKEVKAAPDARTAKKLVSALEDFDRKGWLKIQEGIMEKACLVKFHQNPTLRAELFATGDAVLVEASPSDRCWGVGLSIEDERIADPTQWRGGNLLGRIMMSVRDRLLVQYPQEARALRKKAPRYMP
ncbi:NADAR family protein [Aphelenchoides fujianensis]|nr:NADAR family protein [Aphelenchoides fujianensis]